MSYPDWMGPRVPLGAVLLLLLPAGLWSYATRYLPLSDSETSLRVPQRVLRTKFEQDTSVRVGSTIIRFLGSEVVFSGFDASRKPWTVTAATMFGAGLYSADLDHDGTLDLIYASYTGGNGLAPPMHVLTILFDKAGRPVPSEMDGYFEIDGAGLRDLVDLDGDGRAELVRQAFDDGYWITSLYEARNAHWHLISGQHASRSFPIYTRFTNRANRVPTIPSPGRHPTEDDLSNDVDRFTGVLTAVRWADIQQSGNPEMKLSDGTVCTPVAWYSSMVVVLDGPDGREAATLGAPEDAQALLETIMESKLGVQMKGKRRYASTGDRPFKPTPCIPETVWVTRAVGHSK